MGLLGKIIAAKATQKIVQRLNEKDQWPNVERRGAQQPVPVDRPGNAIVGKATRIYRENPRLVAGLGVVAAAMVLQQLTRKR